MDRLMQIQQVKDLNSPFREGFVKTYKEVFAEPPYNESYEDSWIINNVWNIHIDNGCLLVLLEQNEVIGLCCCIPVNRIVSPDPNVKVKLFLESVKDRLPLSLESTVYMSEIAVKKDFRRNGLGEDLIRARWAWAASEGLAHYLMRTAVDGSLSENLYMKLGAQNTNVIQDVSDHASEVQSASTQRKYLYGVIKSLS